MNDFDDDFVCVTCNNKIIVIEGWEYEMNLSLKLLDKFKLQPSKIYMNQADWDDIVKWQNE